MNLSKTIRVKLAFSFLSIVSLLVLFADFVANDQPIMSVSEKSVDFFAPLDKNTSYETVWYAPIEFKEGLDLKNTMVGPFTGSDHYLGTDHLGRDILAGIIHGGRTSLGIGLLAIITASFLGMLIGGASGFIGDRGFKTTPEKIITVTAIALLTYYFSVTLEGHFTLLWIIIAVIIVVYKMISKVVKKREVGVPLDFLSLKFIEIFSAIPNYFLILALVAFIEPNWLLFAFLIGATSWVGIARLIRAEMINVRSSGYIESAEALGISKRRIFIHHALPNSLGPLPYAITFGIASIVVVESTLSYFGIGLPADSLSWGNSLSGYKNNSSAWWVAFFPGMMIFLTILSLHVTGRWLDERFNPRQRTT